MLLSQLEQLESAGSQLEGDSRQQEGTCDATNKSEAKPKSHAKRGKAARLAGLVKARQMYAEIRVSCPTSDGSVQLLSHPHPKLRATPPVILFNSDPDSNYKVSRTSCHCSECFQPRVCPTRMPRCSGADTALSLSAPCHDNYNLDDNPVCLPQAM